MHTIIFYKQRPRAYLVALVFICTVSLGLAADSLPASANATVPQNPFGPKSDPTMTPAVTPPTSTNTVPSPVPDGSFITTLRAMLLSRFDKNSDGQLDAIELTEARKVLSGGQDARVATPAEAATVARGPLFGLRPLIMSRFDHRGEGRLDTAELAEIHTLLFGPAVTTPNPVDDLAALQKSIIGHFDKNGDGQLDAAERAAAKAWLQQIIADLDKPATEKPMPATK